MPKLKQASAGHWYTKTFVHGVGRIATWQISDEGVERIRSRGFRGEEFPNWLFTELHESGLAFTLGTGFDDQAPLDTLPARAAEKQLDLAISETEQGWVLGVLVPELPAEIFADLMQKANQSLLRKCFLRIDGEKDLLPVSELWPGKGGKSWPVDPHERNYSIALEGLWPKQAGLKFLTAGVPGLDGKGSLFFASDKLGTRVSRGTVLVADSYYYLVADAKRARDLRMPNAVVTRTIGQNSGWKAWEIRFPVAADESVLRWCAQLGVGLEEPKLVLEIVTPPPKRVLVTGVPLLEVGDEVVLSATPTTDHVRLEHFGLGVFHEGAREREIPQLRGGAAGESLYFKYSLRKTGTYQIRAVKGQVSPVTFSVGPRSLGPTAEHVASVPPPLSVRIGENSYFAFDGDRGEERIDVWVANSQAVPQVEIGYPGLLRLNWSLDGMSERRSLTSFEAAELLMQEMIPVLDRKKPMMVEVDAGSFGKLAFRIAPEAWKARTEGLGVVSVMVLSRARWLAATVEALRARGTEEVPMDAASQRSIERLGSFRGCGVLKNMASVPRKVMQQAMALGRMVKVSAGLARKGAPLGGRGS